MTELPAPAPPARSFLQRFEREVDPDDRRRRAEHAKRAYMLCLAKRAVAARNLAAAEDVE
jgi:hypothetical protein